MMDTIKEEYKKQDRLFEFFSVCAQFGNVELLKRYLPPAIKYSG